MATGGNGSLSGGALDMLRAGSNAFGFALWRELRAANPGNLIVSPASIMTALVMTWAGARGETAAEIARVLRLHEEAPSSDILKAAGRLVASLEARREITVRAANRLFAERTCPLLPSFLETVRQDFGAELEPVDFRRDVSAARARINGWVEERTEGRIANLIPPDALGADTRLALVNAIYFLGDWLVAFEERETRSESFRVAGREPADVPTMHRMAKLPFFDRGDLDALELPYRGEDLSMVLLLPRRADGLDAVERSLDARALDAIAGELVERSVQVSLPRFELDPTAPLALAQPLAKMGLRRAFDGARADFTGIADPPDPADRLAISEVFHKGFVRVDEKGTEAAAATAVVMARGMPPKPAVFRADHPFLFFIRDRATGLVLFMGRVTDPR